MAELLRGKPFTITCLYIYFSLLKSTFSYVHSIHSKFVFFSISKWEVISPCLQGSERRSLLRPTGISQFNSNVPKPSYMMHGSRSTFLHVNYNSDLKILQLNTAVSNEGFTSSDKQQETHSPWVQHNSELIPGPWWTTTALQWFPMQLVLIVTPWQFHRGHISLFQRSYQVSLRATSTHHWHTSSKGSFLQLNFGEPSRAAFGNHHRHAASKSLPVSFQHEMFLDRNLELFSKNNPIVWKHFAVAKTPTSFFRNTKWWCQWILAAQ